MPDRRSGSRFLILMAIQGYANLLRRRVTGDVYSGVFSFPHS